MKTFKCPACGSSDLEEVVIDCTVYNKILGVEDEDPVYGETIPEGGEVLHYQCGSCGERLPDVTDIGELISYFKNEL